MCGVWVSTPLSVGPGAGLQGDGYVPGVATHPLLLTSGWHIWLACGQYTYYWNAFLYVSRIERLAVADLGGQGS